MAANILLFIVGLVLAGFTLRDVFETVVVPGGSQAALRVAHRLRVLLLPPWKSLRGRRRGISGAFGPVILVGSFITWMSLLALSFGLLAYAVRADFSPPLRTFGDAVYLAGSALVTVGLSQSFPFGVGRWVVLAAGFCGLGVMTMAVTYLLEVQSSIARRDTGIIKLNTSSGEPPSALTLLERFAAIHNEPELRELLSEGRNWCATVRQSHAAHPSLVYFQSIGTGAGWPAALGALMDLGLLVEHCLDDDSLFGPAVLLQAEGLRMARELALFNGLRLTEVTESESELAQAVQRLGSAGYALRPNPDLAAMAEKRSEYRRPIDALADHLGKPTAVLVRP
ncbi:MAG: hypothetical protein QOF34_382 [Sphingomonadales bacterium]|jgi:hypothetical protein|nr:hypothetical protein [Sphingomonadales bacterium]